MKYLLLDTNIYLHFKDFEQIDWAAMVNDKEFAIVVPYTVIKEIDKHKDGPKGKIKTRAKAVSAKFARYFLEDNYRGKVRVVQIDDPDDELMSTHHLNRNVCDDVIIGSALAFEHKADIVVVSHDNTLLIKAKKFGLHFLPQMPEEYLVAEEKTAEEKELEKCRSELMMLKNRQPKPTITFADGKTVLRLKTPAIADVESELCEIMADIRCRHPHAHRPASTTGRNNIFDIFDNFAGLQYAMYSDEQLEQHNAELDKYYAHSERYERFKLEKRELEKQLQKLQFVVRNEGTAETGHMNVFLDFPESVRLYNDRSKKNINDIKPEAPIIGMPFNELPIGFGMRYISPRDGLNIPQIYCWDLTKCLQRQKVVVDAESLNPGVMRSLKIPDSLYVDAAQSGGFTVHWTVCAAALPRPVSGNIEIIIEADNTKE